MDTCKRHSSKTGEAGLCIVTAEKDMGFGVDHQLKTSPALLFKLLTETITRHGPCIILPFVSDFMM